MDEIINQLINRDQKNFHKLYEHYQPTVKAILNQASIEEDDYEDLNQTIWFKVIKKIHVLKNSYAFKSWLKQITTNVIIDHRRSKARAPHFVSISGVSEEDHLADWDIKDTNIKEENLDAKELIQDLFTMDFKDNHRFQAKLMYVNGASYEEIAKHFQVEVGTIKSRIARSRNDLKKLFYHTESIC